MDKKNKTKKVTNQKNTKKQSITEVEKIDGFIAQIKNNKWIHIAIIVIIGVILSLPLSKICIRDTHDGSLHLLRIIGTINSFKIGEIPPIVAPYFCNGGGYAMNLFYNPLVTYVPLLVKLIVPSYTVALKVFAGLCIILSGITMYDFTFSVTKKRLIALFAAIIYILSPYKLGDVYRRFAIGEFASFIFIPILFTGLYNLFNQGGKKHYYIAVGTIGLILTHTVTTFYIAIISAVYVLINIKKLKNKEIIKKILINLIFIILVTLFFIAPMLEAKNSADYVIFDSDIMSTYGEYVYANTLKIGQLFNDKVTKFEDTIFSIGIPIVIFMALSVITYKKVKEEHAEYKDFYILSLCICLITLYMSTRYCPWKIIPDFLCKLQYPWRLLGFFNVFSSFIVGINMYIILNMFLKKDTTKLIVYLIVAILMILYTLPITLQFETDDYDRDTRYVNSIEKNYKISHMYINRDYLPTKALLQQKKYLKTRDYEKIYVLYGEAEVSNELVENLSIKADVKNCKASTILEFPFFYYPGYQIQIEQNGNITELKSTESVNGFVSAIIPSNIKNGKVTVQYKATTLTYASYVISFVSFVFFIIYVIQEKKKDVLL